MNELTQFPFLLSYINITYMNCKPYNSNIRVFKSIMTYDYKIDLPILCFKLIPMSENIRSNYLVTTLKWIYIYPSDYYNYKTILLD